VFFNFEPGLYDTMVYDTTRCFNCFYWGIVLVWFHQMISFYSIISDLTRFTIRRGAKARRGQHLPPKDGDIENSVLVDQYRAVRKTRLYFTHEYSSTVSPSSVSSSSAAIVHLLIILSVRARNKGETIRQGCHTSHSIVMRLVERQPRILLQPSVAS